MELSARSYFWAAVAVEVIALGIAAWIGPQAGFIIACLGLVFFLPAISEWRQKRATEKVTSGPLGIVHGKGKPWLQVQTGRPDKNAQLVSAAWRQGILYTYRIGIINVSDTPIPNVEVKLTNIEDCPPDFNAIGAHLHFMHDNVTIDQKKTIPPTKDPNYKDAVFVDVFDYFLSTGYSWLEACTIVHGVSRMLPVRDYRITIKVCGERVGELVVGEFLFELRENGSPIFRMA